MKEKLSEYGDLILPRQPEIKGFAIFYPPATGEKGQQEAEAEGLLDLGIASLLYKPPYINSAKGGVADPSGEVELWIEAKSDFQKLKQKIFELFPSAKKNLFVIGKNLGGSVAANSIDSSVKCLIVTGSIPVQSDFWVSSSHPVAAQARTGLSTIQLEEYFRKTRPFDLLRTLRSVRRKILVQFGRQDAWIEPDQGMVFISLYSKICTIKWLDDDHFMNSQASLQQRKEFLEKYLE